MKAKYAVCSLVLVMGFSLMSCSSELEGSISAVQDAENTAIKNHITMEQARVRLCQIIQTKPFARDNMQSVFMDISDGQAYDSKGEILTRSSEDQALYYVFNIGSEGDYAIMGATNELPELIAYSQGVHDSNNCDVSPGTYASYLSSLRDSLAINLNSIHDPIQADSLEIHYQTSQTEYSLLNDVQPMDIRWGKGYPYNYALATVGCRYDDPNDWGLPASTTYTYIIHPQIRPVMQKPYDYEFYSDLDTCRYFDWDLMYTVKSAGDCKNPDKYLAVCQTSTLLREMYRNVGNPKYAPMEYMYYLNYEKNLPSVFNRLGVSGGKCEVFNMDKAIDEIGLGYPIIMFHLEPYGYTHTWVVDAMLIQKIPYVVINKRTGHMIESGNRILYMPHCNWVMGGEHDGYFLPELLRPDNEGINPFDKNSKENTTTTNMQDTVNINNLRMFYGGRVVNR